MSTLEYFKTEALVAELARRADLDPEGIIDLLEARGVFNGAHISEVGENFIAVQHPLRCRRNEKSLFDCAVGYAALHLPGPPRPTRYLYNHV